MTTKIDWTQIECERCGNCCPNTCKHKVGNLCAVHPSIVGEQEAIRSRGWGGCHESPLVLATYRHYCPPVVRILEEHGVKVIPRRARQGNVEIANYHEVMAQSRRLRGLE